MVLRYRDRDNQQVVKVDYSLSNAAHATPLWQFARVAKAEHRIEDCIQRSKSEAGLADYEVRNWTGWQHHQTLSLLATWFLVQETERGKKTRVAKLAGVSSLQASQDMMRDHGESADAESAAGGGSLVPAAALARP